MGAQAINPHQIRVSLRGARNAMCELQHTAQGAPKPGHLSTGGNPPDAAVPWLEPPPFHGVRATAAFSEPGVKSWLKHLLTIRGRVACAPSVDRSLNKKETDGNVPRRSTPSLQPSPLGASFFVKSAGLLAFVS